MIYSIVKGEANMKAAICCICFLLCIYPPGSYGMNEKSMKYVMDTYPAGFAKEQDKQELTAMEALDLVKERYSANFDKVVLPCEDDYYYKLSFAEYYLVYEGQGETEEEALYHLYEFVLDEPEEGIGHTVTYGWYSVNRVTGEMKELP